MKLEDLLKDMGKKLFAENKLHSLSSPEIKKNGKKKEREKPPAHQDTQIGRFIPPRPGSAL